MFRRASATPERSALSLRATLTIATLFWVYACLAVVLRLELTRQGLSGKGPSVGVLTTCCVVMYPILCALTWISWRYGYDTARWVRLVLVNTVLACVFGMTSRPSYILATAGLLAGKCATTHWAAMKEFDALGDDFTAVTEARWVDEGNVITAAGVSAGIDMSLHLVGRLWTPEVARKVPARGLSMSSNR